MSLFELPVLGIGVIYSAALEPLLRSHPELIDVIEFEPQTSWIKRPGPDPYEIHWKKLDHIRELPFHKLVHSVGAPIGGTQAPNHAQLACLRTTVQALEAPWASEHLSFNQTSEFDTGFLLPPRQTPEGVETASRSIQALKSALGVPVCIETGVNYLRPRAEELQDGEFVAQVVERADCGLLLDLHNVYSNSLNSRQNIDEYLEQLPLERVVEIHLAGGMEEDGYYLDAHCGAIPEALLRIAEKLMPRLWNVRAMIFEIYPSFLPLVGLEVVRDQLVRMRTLWNLRPRAPADLMVRNIFRRPEPQEPAAEPDLRREPSAAWEEVLGRLVIGQPPDGDVKNSNLARSLERDPGVQLVQKLIFNFRASLIVNVLRLSCRLMMLRLGQGAVLDLLQGYFKESTPQVYAVREAARFMEYLHAAKLQIPCLDRLLEYEKAVADTLIDGQPRMVHFDFYPTPLLESLAESRLPEKPLCSGTFQIMVTADGVAHVTGVEKLHP